MKRIISIFLIATACQTDDIKQESMSSDYIIFGHFYGECMGEQCVEIYKLADNSLYEDSKDEYPLSNNAYNGIFQLLDNSLFEKVKDLRNHIPTELLEINSVFIGQPDAGDWGGIYFEIVTSGKKRYWLIDKMESNIPENLRPFVDKIENKIELINN
jgi:hypothetical protein